MTGSFTGFFRVTFLYMLAAGALTSILLEDPLGTVVTLAQIASGFLQIIGSASLKFTPVVLVLLWWFGQRIPMSRLRALILVALGSVWLQVGFLLFKSAIPQVVPFFADPFFTSLDRALLFGHDGWEVAHLLTPDFAVAWFPVLYLTTWSLLAYAFPVAVTVLEREEDTALRYLWLFFLSWVACGNITALAGASVGPIFYDQLSGGDRFAALHAALAQSGFAAGPIGYLQDRLWERSGGPLSFISAFPSVHIAVVTVLALYLRERLPKLQIAGYTFAALVLLISVYSGYHYLVDGIASVAIVLGLHLALIRWFARKPALPGLTGAATPAISPHLP